MLFQFNPNFATLSATALVSATVGLIAWKRRLTCSASRPFVGLMMAVTGYATVAALEAGSISLSNKIFWSKLEYAGSGSVITLFLIFVLDFTHRRQWLTWRNIALLWILPIFNLVLAVTNEWHQLVWTGFVLESQQNYVVYEHGPGFFWVMMWSYFYGLVAIFLLTRAAVKASLLQRQQSSLVLLGAIVPVFGSTFYMLDLVPPGLNLTPMSFMVTGLIYFASLFRFRMFDLVPVARDALIENMSDGVLVLDLQQRIMDFNPSAQRLMRLSSTSVGQAIAYVLPQWQSLLSLSTHPRNMQMEFFIDGGMPRYIELRATPLYDRSRRLTGCLLVLRDVTQQHAAEVELRQANEQLQQQLLEIETLQVQLREQAIRDGLTGLFNRRYFEETLVRELIRAARGGYSVAIILLDIDHFKRINDTFGHQGGDRVLQALGKLLLQNSRASDIPCRYGGEEFALVLPEMDLIPAQERAEAIRVSFQNIRVIFGSHLIQTTMSAGVGVFPKHGQDAESLMYEIDQALYKAKATGRNQIRVARSLS